MIRKASTNLVRVLITQRQQTVVQDLNDWLMSAATLTLLSLEVNFNVDRHTSYKALYNTSQLRRAYPRMVEVF